MQFLHFPPCIRKLNRGMSSYHFKTFPQLMQWERSETISSFLGILYTASVKKLPNTVPDIAIATTGSQLSFKAHPVFCLMKKTVLSHLDIFLNSGQRKIEAWYSSLKTSLVHFSDEAAFSNINTIEELKALENQSKI